MAKERIPLTSQLADEIMYSHSRICCVCEDKGVGLNVQIHHIDENPSNNDPSNLAVLCKQHHDEAHTSPHMSRGLTSSAVRHHRDRWVARVTERRERADQLSAGDVKPAPAISPPTEIPSPSWEEIQSNFAYTRLPRLAYIRSLPQLRLSAYELAREKWDVRESPMETTTMDLIDIMQQVWLHLSTWYAPGEKPAKTLLSEHVHSLYEWHRAIATPAGEEGSDIRMQFVAHVLEDMETAIVRTVEALTRRDEFDFIAWREEWDRAGPVR